jgi:hypothetical protein
MLVGGKACVYEIQSVVVQRGPRRLWKDGEIVRCRLASRTTIDMGDGTTCYKVHKHGSVGADRVA